MAISRMQRAYRAATKASIDELEALEGRIQERLDNGEEPSDTILWMRQRIIDNIAELGQNLKKFSVEGAKITADGQRESAILANEATLGMAEAAAGKKPAGVEVSIPWTTLPDEQLQAFVGMAGNGSPLGELFAKIPQVTEDAMLNALASGISLGEGPRTVARRVRKVAEIGRHRAETIARTEMIRSAREAQRMLYQQNPAVQSYRRVATQDARVCLACLALSGTVHTTDEIMPSHPNCRCVMVPVTLTWAEITGDPNIPDTSLPVVTPEVILAGLSDEDKLEIMGARRLQAYKDGLPLQDMVQVKQNADWGPTTSILPLSKLGKPAPKPEPPVAPKPQVKPKRTPRPKPITQTQESITPPLVESPKPIRDATPSINRDPQALLDAFRKLLQTSRPQEEIQKDIDQYDADRMAFFASYKGSLEDAMADWKKNHEWRLDALWEEQQGKVKTKSKIREMHKLMFSEDPQKIKPIWFNDNLGKDQQIDSDSRKGVTDCIDYVMRFIDSRPLKRSSNSLLSRSIDVEQMSLIADRKSNANGYCQWTGQGHIAINTKIKKLPKEFAEDFSVQDGHRTLAHEIMHWLDARDSNLRQRINVFWEKRTTGDKWTTSPYGGQYKKDKWADAYCGQRYESLEARFGQGFEIPTRGMEFLLADPLKFAETDFEYFSFMITDVLGLGK